MQPPDSKEPRDSFFNKVYPALFLTVGWAVLGGGFFVWAAQSAMARMNYDLHRASQVGFHHKNNFFDLFYNCGITDWRAQFGIGAASGAGGAVRHLKWRNRKAGE